MNKKTLQGMLLLFIATWAWGVAFVAQSVGTGYMNAFAFNCIRNFIGAAVLVPVIMLRKRRSESDTKTIGSQETIEPTKNDGITRKNKCLPSPLLLGGIVCGAALCIAANFQQLGIEYSTVGKSAFITTLYIIFVPILGLFLKKKVPFGTWIGVILSLIGLYLLCMKNEAFVLGQGDIYLLLCALFFSIQILLVDYFVQRTDPIKLSALQFLCCGIFSGIGMFFTEVPSWSNILGSAIPLLYAGAVSTGIGFTFQVIGQKDVPATIASLIMSLESVIAGLAGWVLLHEVLSKKELFGCGLVFVAIIITQLPLDKLKPKIRHKKETSS